MNKDIKMLIRGLIDIKDWKAGKKQNISKENLTYLNFAMKRTAELKAYRNIIEQLRKFV